MTIRRTRSGRGEEGYALLALLASSAILLAGLALSIPRMAMQSQRLKDERLIERGRQYQRAIKLYYREHKKYPQELEDLEDIDGVRYLRRRYPDPIGETGEWRLIHMGTDGRFEDSLLHDLSKDEARRDAGLSGIPPPGIMAGRVASRATAQAPPDPPGIPGSAVASDPRMTMAEGQAPFLGGGRVRASRESAAPDLATRNRYSQGFEFNAGQSGDLEPDGVGEDTGRPDYSKMLPSSIPMDENEYQARNADTEFAQQGRGGRANGVQNGSPGARGFARAPGMRATAPSAMAGGQAARTAGTGAAQLINRLLTSPRPGGMAGATGAQPQAAMAPVFERGIAGVASKSKDVGVKVYNGKEPYNEWEFVYDYRKDTGVPSNAAAVQPTGTPGNQVPNRPRTRSRGRAMR